MYTHPFSFRFFLHIDYRRTLGRFPVLYTWPCWPVIPCASVHMPIPNPQSIPPHPPVPFGNHKFFKVCESVSLVQISLFVLFLLDSTYKWFHVIIVFVCLTLYAAHGIISVLFYGRVVFHCMYTPHLLYPFLRQWTFRLFHVLAIVYSAAVNIGCTYLFKLQISPDGCPGLGLLDHKVVLFLVFEEPPYRFP